MGQPGGRPKSQHGVLGFLTADQVKERVPVLDGESSSARAVQPDSARPEGERAWLEIYADRLGRIISCYQTPEEREHAAHLEDETNRVVAKIKDEVAQRGVDWRQVPPPRPVGVESGGIVLAWDEPAWGAEIEIETPAAGEQADVFIWADQKGGTPGLGASGDADEELLEELQSVYYERLIRLLCGQPVA